MENICSGQVFEVTGEPAIVINGVPDLTLAVGATIHQDTFSNVKSKHDPCFGEWLEGRKAQKMFGKIVYNGVVVKFDGEFYTVVYEDGDSEDLEWHELEEVLIPLDISISLETMAVQMIKRRTSCEIGHKASISNRVQMELSVQKGPQRDEVKVSEIGRQVQALVHCGSTGLQNSKRSIQKRVSKTAESEKRKRRERIIVEEGFERNQKLCPEKKDDGLV
ncbi:hypothetical protein QJS10_CPB20g00778 [Acorus calamus]|uniref:PTM/DIR17-like Tudor domain-containing protein n=1 Tax=Acorus calamus TaxID=4465 RepID=A0AAV9CDH3_ACOCL|nr:hypothetical protein QJS10_CPB20g00778 [Acorus calamus]